MSATIDAKTAKKLKLLPRRSRAKSLSVGRGSLGLGTGARPVTLKFTKKAASKLKKLKAVKLTISSTVTDGAGNATRAASKFTLKR
jgi:hypothetical protein